MQFEQNNNLVIRPKNGLLTFKARLPFEEEVEDDTLENNKKKLISAHLEIANICREQKSQNGYNIHFYEAKFIEEDKEFDNVKIKQLLHEAYSSLAEQYSLLEIYDKAARFCILCSRLGPPLTPLLGKAYLNLGHEYKFEEDNKRAAHFYKLALSHEVQDDKVSLWLGNYYCSLAYDYFQQKDLIQAIDYGLEANRFGIHSIRPWIGQCYFQMGENYFNNQEYLNALKEYKNAIQFGANYSRDKFAECILLLSSEVKVPCQRSVNILEKIHQYLLEAVGPRSKPLTIEGYLKKLLSEHYEDMALSEQKKGNIFSTSEWFKKALQYSPTDIALREKLLDSYEKLYVILEKEKSSFEDSLEKKQKFIELSMNMVEIYYQKAHYWRAKNKYLILKELGEEIDDKLSQCYHIYATNAFNKKEYKIAIGKYLKSLGYNNDDRVRQELALCYIADGDDELSKFQYEFAQASFIKAKEILSSFPILLKIKLKICDLIIKGKNNKDMDNSFKIGEQFFQLGNLFRKKKKFAEAEEYFDRAKNYNYNNEKIIDAINLNRAENYFEQLQFKDSINLFNPLNKNKEFNNQLLTCHEKLGDECYFDNDFKQAIFYYQNAIKITNIRILTRRRLAECQYYFYKNNKQLNIEKIASYILIVADCFAEEKNLDAAIRWYRRIFNYFHTSAKPDITEKFLAACKLKVDIYLTHSHYQRARELIEEIYPLLKGDKSSIDSSLAKCLQEEARECFQNKSFLLSIQYYEQSLKFCSNMQVKEDLISAYSSQAKCYLQFEKYEKALEYLKIVLKNKPENEIVKNHIYLCNRKIGLNQYEKKKFKSASIYLKESHAFKPDDKIATYLANCYCYQGDEYFKNKQFTTANEYYELAGTLNSLPPELIAAKQSEVNAAIHYQKGWLCSVKKDYSNAITFGLHAVLSQPTHNLYIQFLIKAYTLKGHVDFIKSLKNNSSLEQAENSYLQAIKWSNSIKASNTKLSWVFLRLAIIYVNQDNYEESQKILSTIEINEQSSFQFLLQLIDTYISISQYYCNLENYHDSAKWIQLIEKITEKKRLLLDNSILGSHYKILADSFLNNVRVGKQRNNDKSYLDIIYYYKKAKNFGIQTGKELNVCHHLRKELIKKSQPQNIKFEKLTPGEDKFCELKLQADDEKDLEATLVISSATFLFEKKQFHEAIPLFKEICTLGFSSEDVLKDLALCYQNIGDLFFENNEYLKAIEYYTSPETKPLINQVQTNLNDAYHKLGIIEYNQNNYQQAINYFKNIPIEARNDTINYYLSKCLLLINEKLELKTDQIKIELSTLSLSLAHIDFKNNHFNLALESFSKFFSYNLELPDKDKKIYIYSLLRMANENYAKKEYSLAADNYQKILKYGHSNLITKKLLRCYFNLFRTDCENQQFESAHKLCDSARKLLSNECLGKAYEYVQESKLIPLKGFLTENEISYEMLYIMLCQETFYLYRTDKAYVITKHKPDTRFFFVQTIAFENTFLLKCIDKYFYLKLRLKQFKRDSFLSDDSISPTIQSKITIMRENIRFIRILINIIQPLYFKFGDKQLQNTLTRQSHQNNRYYGDNLSDDSDADEADDKYDQQLEYQLQIMTRKYVKFLKDFIKKIKGFKLDQSDLESFQNRLEGITISDLDRSEIELPSQAEEDLKELNNLIKSKGRLNLEDLNKFNKTKFYVAHYRGINYMKDRWGTKARRSHYKKNEQGKLQFCESILNCLFSEGISIFNGDDHHQKDHISKHSNSLTEESKKLQNFLISLDKTSPCIAKTNPRQEITPYFYYDNVGDAFQNLSSNGIEEHLKEISQLRIKYPYWKQNLPNAYNYRISMSDSPYHAIRYAIGAKTYYGAVAIPRYHGNGSPEYRHVGKCYLFLEPLEELVRSTHIKRLFHLQRNGRLDIDPLILNEREVAYLAYTPNPIHSHITIKYPDFSKRQHFHKYGLTDKFYDLLKKAIEITRPYTPENEMIIKLLTHWLCLFYEKQMISLVQNFDQGIIVYWHADGCLGAKPDPNWNRKGDANSPLIEKTKNLRNQRKQEAKNFLNEVNHNNKILDEDTIPGLQLVSKKAQHLRNYHHIFSENEYKLKSQVTLFANEQAHLQKIRLKKPEKPGSSESSFQHILKVGQFGSIQSKKRKAQEKNFNQNKFSKGNMD